MTINIDNSNTDIQYVDKANLNYAFNDNIIKLNTSKFDTSNVVLVNVIAGYYNLDDTDKIILNYLYNKNGINEKDIINDIKDVVCLSTSSIIRHLNYIKDKSLIYYDSNNNIYLSNSIDVKDKDLNEIKYIVIEITNNVIKDKI